MTTWKPIPGYEGAYEASADGEIRSWKVYRGKPGPRGLKATVDPKGYPHVWLSNGDGTQSRFSVHRLVMAAHVGPLPTAHETRHLDGNPLNNALANLRYGTRSENKLDTVRHGRNANAAKTHCKRNHEFTPENTTFVTGRRPGLVARRCRTCDALRARRRRASTTTPSQRKDDA